MTEELIDRFGDIPKKSTAASYDCGTEKVLHTRYMLLP